MADLAEAVHMGQTLRIISVGTKLHKQLEVQERSCACVSLGSHRTADAKHSNLFQPSFHALCFFLQGAVSLTSLPSVMLQVQLQFSWDLETPGNLETDFFQVLRRFDEI